MKLRNKKTLKVFDVEIRPVFYENIAKIKLKDIKTGAILALYNTLAELNEEWEDYKEPKQQYYIKANGDIGTCGAIEDDMPDEMLSKMEEIGNKFETEEECEKAVEKLKAWTRLRKKGFKFTDYKLYRGSKIIDREFAISAESPVYVDHKDLDLLFGGEE